MKQILLFASAIALMTSCAKTDVAPGEESNLPKGISFQAQIGDDTKAQWNEAEGKFNMFWYAEADKIDVYFQNANVGQPAVPSAAANKWSKTETATYKATRSTANGLFTATDDQNLISFIRPAVEKQDAAFFAVWPTGLTVDDGAVTGESLKIALPLLDNQTQDELSGSSTVENIFMYSEQANVIPANEYEAVADRLVLSFVRPVTAIYYKITNYEKNASVYGPLESIKIESLGKRDGTSADGTPKYDAGTKSALDYGVASFDTKDKKIVPGTTKSDVTLTVNAPKWEDNAVAYMAINPVKRTFVEGMKITYTFDKVEIIKTVETSENWPVTAGNFVGAPVLDLDNEEYVLSIDQKALVVNKGTFKAAYDAAVKAGADMKKLTTLVSKVALTSTEMALLTDMTDLVDVTLNENSEIPSKTFTQTGLTKVSMAKVTKIADDGFAIQTVLATLELPAYAFDNAKVIATLLPVTAAGNAVLTSLDMSAVLNTKLEFNSEALSLTKFTKLTDVTVKNGLIVGANMFDGCAALANVKFPKGTENGSIELGGNSIFNGCAKLKAISISNTTIPASSFKGCSILETTLQNGVAKSILKPIFVGAEAFSGCAKIKSIDLTVAATIGQSAFSGALALTGVMFVNELTTLAPSTFEGCVALKRITFAKVTKVGDDAFKGATLDHLEFKEKITSAEKTAATANTFGTTTATKLFLNIGQEGVVGNKLTLKSVDGSKSTPFDFASIS